MNRKDTIIVAVLVNVGLLIVLFASAIKSGREHEDFVVAASQPEKLQAIPVKDEVDMVLSQYAKTTPVIAETLPLPSPVVTATQPMSAPSLMDELKITSEPQQPENVVAAAPLAETPTVEFVEYRVKKGDVLEKIARHHHCSVQDLKKTNHLTTTALKIGQVLKIPKEVAKTKSQNPAKMTSAEEGSAKYYTIKVGDNPWTIAIKNHMKVEELLKLNNLDEEKARRLKAGDKIRVQ